MSEPILRMVIRCLCGREVAVLQNERKTCSCGRELWFEDYKPGFQLVRPMTHPGYIPGEKSRYNRPKTVKMAWTDKTAGSTKGR